MGDLQRALPWMRPLVESQSWDYCVVWKLADDPSRFIEWVGCCCSGAYGVCVNVKEENTEEPFSSVVCRDTFIQHCAKTKACGALSHFPSSIPLYSGIHGEAVISTETKWLNCPKDSNSNVRHESTGTWVLIPVIGGLIELFAAKHVPKDQKIIDFVKSQCNIQIEDETVAAQSYTSTSLYTQPPDQLTSEYSRHEPTFLHYLNFGHILPIPPTLSRPCICPFFEGSSTESNPAHYRHLSLNSYSGHVSPNASVNEFVEKDQTHTTPISKKTLPLPRKESVSFVEGANRNGYVQKDDAESGLEMEKEQYQSKNLITERNRRNRINDGLRTLRSLVPKISKMDKTSILVDAIAYIEELKNEEDRLQNELRETIVETCEKKNESRISDFTAEKQDKASSDVEKQVEMQVEVNQIGKRDFLVKLLCNHRQGVFARLMEVTHSLGVQVIDANTTTFDGKMMNIMKVEVNKSGVQPKVLKDSLIKLTSNFY